MNRKGDGGATNIGDGSLACGPVWEAMVFGTMEQFKTLWDEDHRGGLPIIYTFVNNGYAMGGQPNGETMGMRELVRVAAGLNPEMMHAERVDGYSPLAVIDAYERKGAADPGEAGTGPSRSDHLSPVGSFAFGRLHLSCPRGDQGLGGAKFDPGLQPGTGRAPDRFCQSSEELLLPRCGRN